MLARLNETGAGPQPAFTNDDVMLTIESATGTHTVCHQRVRGAEIVGARYRVHRDAGGNVTITGRPLGDVAARDPGSVPAVAPEEAARAARSLFDIPAEIPIGIERAVFPVGDQGVWAFEARFRLDEPIADVRSFLRADDLSLMLSYNVACAGLFGEARVYEINPGRTPEPRVVRLEGLGPEPADRLIGATIDVRPRKGERFVNPLRDWRLEPGYPGFEEASAYYQLAAAIRWCVAVVGRQPFETAPFTPLKVLVGDRANSGNALFIPSTGEIVFGGGDSRPTALSADFVFHEFTHALADAICRLNRSAVTQAKGLSEGYADYVAASAFDDPRFGDWVSGMPDGARNCAQSGLRFPPGWKGEEHALGAVWAAVLWGIRGRVGPEVADLLALESLQFLGPTSTFEDGRAALLKADQQLFPSGTGPGRHQDVIEEEFDARRPPS
ncbi:MAG: hypothetical protein M3276_04175 [Actinomycetota bacterium]|nr:hypothetical protein [Actinomycetota bacterium]